MYSSILFPVDLEHSGSWSKALPVVRKLATSLGAQVHVVTVVADVRGTAAAEFFPADFEQRVVERAQTDLKDFVTEHLADIGEVHAHVEAGRPYKQIVAAAERLGCDLIVMASHKPQLLDVLIGPNADNVVRHAKCSVLVVRD